MIDGADVLCLKCTEIWNMALFDEMFQQNKWQMNNKQSNQLDIDSK